MFIVIKGKTMGAPEERHQGTMSDAAPPELITFSIRYYKHWAPPEPRIGQTPTRRSKTGAESC